MEEMAERVPGVNYRESRTFRSSLLQLFQPDALATTVDDLAFVYADKELIEVAQTKGLATGNPVTDEG